MRRNNVVVTVKSIVSHKEAIVAAEKLYVYAITISQTSRYSSFDVCVGVWKLQFFRFEITSGSIGRQPMLVNTKRSISVCAMRVKKSLKVSPERIERFAESIS